jgi:signal transduction histidine kinase/ligand-binding sensor domain-containing protein/CheY-like chemotaxis protein
MARPPRQPLPTPGLRRTATLAALLFAATAAPGLDKSTPLHQYGSDTWSRQQGFTGGTVLAIQQLADDYLWLHTSGGLVRFDGMRFVPIHPPVAEGAPGEPLIAVGAGRNGTLVARSRSRTFGLIDNHLQELAPPLLLPKGRSRTVRQSSDGRIWIGADNQIYVIEDGKLHFLVEDVSWTNAIAEDDRGRIWFATNNGIYAFDSLMVRYFPARGYGRVPDFRIPHEIVQETINHGPGSCNAMLRDGSGFWIGSVDGLWRLENDAFTQDEISAPCQGVSIYALLRDREGNLWVGTDGRGLMRHDGRSWDTFSSHDGLVDDTVFALAEDKEGSIWIGTRSGLARLRDTPLRTLTHEDGLPADNTWSVVVARDGAVYTATANAGVARIAGDTTTVFNAARGLPRDAGGALFECSDGAVWATTDMGVSRIHGDAITTFQAEGRLRGTYVPAISEDERSIILGHGSRHLFRLAGDRLEPFPVPMAEATGPRSVRYVWHIHRDRAGTLWFAMSGGLYSLRAGEPPENARPSALLDLVNSIGEDDLGYLWLAGSETPGFTRLNTRDGTIVRYTPQAGATVRGIARILADTSGNLWMNTSDGIAWFARDGLDAFADGRATQVSFRLYDELDGLRTPDCGLVGPQPAAARGPDGTMYFTSRKGLVVADPRRIRPNTLIPPVRIEEIVIDGAEVPRADAIVVPPGAERVEIHYTALSLRVPGRVRFRFKLDGLDTDWVDAGTRRTAFFTRIPAGTYAFHAQACNDDGLWNTVGATIGVRVRPRWHETRWAGAGFAALLGTAAYGTFVFRTRNMRRRQAQLSSLVDERTAALRTEVAERTAAEQKLTEHRARLEELVQARTADLRETNVRLQAEIAERNRSEERLRQSQKLESVGRLAGGVAHDFNNLLTVIIGYCDVLLEDSQPGDESRALATEIKMAGEKAASLTRQLLAFSRKQILQPVAVDLNQLVAEMDRMLRRLLPEDVSLVTEGTPQPAMIVVDTGQVSQVILNLVINARDAMPDGGAIRLRIETIDAGDALIERHPEVVPGRYVQLTVRDSGHGMDAATMGRIFEPFFTTKGMGKGTGLGLSTVFGIVKQSGGHIWVESAPGQGSTFTLVFPCVEGMPAGEAAQPRPEAATGSGETVLVVEDQADVRALACTILENRGYRVLQARSGEEALQLLETYTETIHVLCTDVVMPGMSGRQLAERLLTLRPDVGVVFMTGYAPDSMLQQHPRHTGCPLLHKPFSADQLAAAIRTAIAQRPESAHQHPH